MSQLISFIFEYNFECQHTISREMKWKYEVDISNQFFSPQANKLKSKLISDFMLIEWIL